MSHQIIAQCPKCGTALWSIELTVTGDSVRSYAVQCPNCFWTNLQAGDYFQDLVELVKEYLGAIGNRSS